VNNQRSDQQQRWKTKKVRHWQNCFTVP